MTQSLLRVSLLVGDYDEAISYYVEALGFDLLEDTPIPRQGKRWVVVRPPGSSGCTLVLAVPSNDAQRAALGQQCGDRVFLFLATDNFDRDYARYRSVGVEFLETPRSEPYGKVAVFRDRYGNRWDLIEQQ